MSRVTHKLPWMASLSVLIYGRLLVFYPLAFRRQYGSHMIQVFRDCCHEAVHTDGNVGLWRYWLIASADLIVSALAERRREEVHMLRTFWIRFGSLAAIIGNIGPAVVSGLFLTILLGQRFAPHAQLSLNLPFEYFWVGVAQSMCYVLALVSLWIYGMNRTGVIGRTGIAVATTGAVIEGVGYVLMVNAMFRDARQVSVGVNISSIGSVVLASGMIVYGVIALRHRLLPRFNWLPLVVGLAELLDRAVGLIGIQIVTVENYPILGYASILATAVVWILLGIALWPRGDEEAAAQSTQPEPAV